MWALRAVRGSPKLKFLIRASGGPPMQVRGLPRQGLKADRPGCVNGGHFSGQRGGAISGQLLTSEAARQARPHSAVARERLRGLGG
jgi:hypothetical protein